MIENLGKINGNGYWLGRCDCGNMMKIQSGQLKTIRSCGKGIHHPHYQEDPSYYRVHERLARKRGPARDAGPCASCGGEAQEWSYDGTDPDPRYHPRGWAYSADLSRYHPRCARCHRKKDFLANVLGRVKR